MGTRIGYWWESLRGKGLLGKTRCRWLNNIKMDLGKLGWGGLDWIDLAHDRDKGSDLVIAVMNLQVT
jgi:hypothetical protein